MAVPIAVLTHQWIPRLPIFHTNLLQDHFVLSRTEDCLSSMTRADVSSAYWYKDLGATGITEVELTEGVCVLQESPSSEIMSFMYSMNKTGPVVVP
ncbi:hypothetical protein M8J76_013073 [Diaphorina citri]|nr:hypothetical protein M8J76_013073 [Diaphorina citri]